MLKKHQPKIQRKSPGPNIFGIKKELINRKEFLTSSLDEKIGMSISSASNQSKE